MSVAEPRRVEVHLGALCNNRCVFCVSSEARDEHSPWALLERVQEELRHFHAQGCRAAGFLGGEPTVYPHIVESVAYARELGYERISLCTNGTRLSDPDFCRALVGAGLTRVTMSVHSHRAEVEDGMITLVPGNLDKKLAGLSNLAALRAGGALKDGVSLNPVLCRPTLREMEAYIAFFGARGFDDIRFNFIWPQGVVQNDLDWVPPLRVAAPEILRIVLLNEKRLHKRLSFGGVPRCALALAGVSGPLLDYLGDKYLDEGILDADNDVTMANKDERSSDRFVWQEVKRDMLKTLGPACSGCSRRRSCEGVWKTYAELHGFEDLRPLPEPAR